MESAEHPAQKKNYKDRCNRRRQKKNNRQQQKQPRWLTGNSRNSSDGFSYGIGDASLHVLEGAL